MARLKESVARVEQERDALQKSLIEVRAELAQSNEARAEMAGQLAVLRPMQGSTTGVAAPTTAPTTPRGAEEAAPSGNASRSFASPDRPMSAEPAAAAVNHSASAAAPPGAENAQGPVMTAEMLKAGRAGDATAQCVIGYCYAAGQGVRQHWAEALKWYRAAAEQGHPNAQYNLGTCYAKGRGVRLGVDVQTWDECWEKAVYWFSLAAEQGDAAAQCNLATCYLKGQGVEQDRPEAIRWYEQAAQRGDEKARRHLEALLGGGGSS